MPLYVKVSRLHLHTEAERAASAPAVGMDRDCASVQLDELLDDCEPESYAFVVHLSSAMQLTEPRE